MLDPTAKAKISIASIPFSLLLISESSRELVLPQSPKRATMRGGGRGKVSVSRVLLGLIGGVVILLYLCLPQTSSTQNMNTLLIEPVTTARVFLSMETAHGAAASSSAGSCDPMTSKIFSERVLIDFEGVHAMSKERLRQLKKFTARQYENLIVAPPGHEHYSLLEYLISTFGPAETRPCPGESEHQRHVMDIGSRFVATSLALGAFHGTRVKTFDVAKSKERKRAFRGKTENQWEEAVLTEGVHITSISQNLLTLSNKEFASYTATWFILLDAYNFSRSEPFQREFFARLVASGYQGILIIDNFRLNAETQQWWAELIANESAMGYRCFDLTSVGHASGTGLVDFSGKVEIKPQNRTEKIAKRKFKLVAKSKAAKTKPVGSENRHQLVRRAPDKYQTHDKSDPNHKRNQHHSILVAASSHGKPTKKTAMATNRPIVPVAAVASAPSVPLQKL